MTAALLPLTPALERRVRGTPLIVMLDVDGTLAPIVSRPELATVPVETRRAVAALVALPDVTVALVSGRAARDATRIVDVAGVWVIGNHGCEVVAPDGTSTVNPRVAPFEEPMARAVRALRARLGDIPGVIVEDKVWTLSVHYRLADRAVVPAVRQAVEEIVRREGLRPLEGKEILEGRPPVTVHKGTAVLELAERLGGLAANASLVFAGDDRTDEDAFESLREHNPSAVTIRVADEPIETAAEFLVDSLREMQEFLEWLAGLPR